MTTLSYNFPVRVYYEDTDAGGVVYHSTYLNFMERARTEFLRESGIELGVAEAEHGVLFAVTEAHLKYLSPARHDDLLEIETMLAASGGARLFFTQNIRRRGEDAILVSGEIQVACMDRNGKARRIPANIQTVIRAHLPQSVHKE